MPKSDDTTTDERYVVPGLLRGLKILQTFSRERQQQTVAEMARQVNITRSTAFRIVYTLERSGFLQRIDDGRRYQLGSRVLELGYGLLAGKDIVEISNPVLRRLRDDTKMSTHLVVREGRDAVYVSRYQGNTSLISALTVGSRLPAYATTSGRILLTGLSLAEIVALYENYSFEPFTTETPDNIGALISLVERDRKEASVISWGFYDPSLASIAAPVFNAAGKLEAALSVSCPLNTYERDVFEGPMRRAVEDAAAEVSRGLGYRAVSAA